MFPPPGEPLTRELPSTILNPELNISAWDCEAEMREPEINQTLATKTVFFNQSLQKCVFTAGYKNFITIFTALAVQCLI